MSANEKRYFLECQNCDWKQECDFRAEAIRLRREHEDQHETHNAWIVDRQAK